MQLLTKIYLLVNLKIRYMAQRQENQILRYNIRDKADVSSRTRSDWESFGSDEYQRPVDSNNAFSALAVDVDVVFSAITIEEVREDQKNYQNPKLYETSSKYGGTRSPLRMYVELSFVSRRQMGFAGFLSLESWSNVCCFWRTVQRLGDIPA